MNVSGSKVERKSNIELLRIVMMLSLVAHHFIVNSGIMEAYDSSNVSFNMVFAQIFGMWGKTAINVFTLITGYFMIKSNLTLRKLLKLVLEIMFYALLFYIVFLIAGYEIFSLKHIIKLVLCIPYEAGTYYSASMVVMMILSPFANKLAAALNKKQYETMLMWLFVYFTCLSSFLKHETFNFVFWMLSVYMFGGYLRMYPSKWDKLSVGIIGTMLSFVLMSLSIISIDYIGCKIGFDKYYFFLSDANKILAIMAAVCIFILFKNWNLRYVKFINVIATATFGVLLIHANSDAMRRFLWVDVFDNVNHYYTVLFPFYACGVVLLVYILCVIVDLVRITFIEKTFFKWLEKFEWIDKELW